MRPVYGRDSYTLAKIHCWLRFSIFWLRKCSKVIKGVAIFTPLFLKFTPFLPNLIFILLSLIFIIEFNIYIFGIIIFTHNRTLEKWFSIFIYDAIMYYFVDWPKKYIRLSFLFYVCNSAGATPMRRKRSSLALGKVWTWNGDYGGVLIPLLKSNVPANLDRTPLHFAAMQVELTWCNFLFRRWTQTKTENENHIVSSAAWVCK